MPPKNHPFPTWAPGNASHRDGGKPRAAAALQASHGDGGGIAAPGLGGRAKSWPLRGTGAPYCKQKYIFVRRTDFVIRDFLTKNRKY